MKEHNGYDIMASGRKPLGLYLHIPFCAKKCDYCDFLSAPATEATITEYVKAMLTELEQYEGATQDYFVPTIYIGGGTPSLIEAYHIEELMNAASRIFLIDKTRLEATIEINPGTITEEKLRTYQSIGINRLSFGLQSTDNKELSILGRIHTYEQFEENYRLARELGFQNINIDLMSAIPGQTLSSWETTLKRIIELNPEHISAYSLIIEEGTRFYERYEKEGPSYMDLPDEDTDRMMYHRTKELLLEQGYHRYEISNYAKTGKECRHNCSYWTGIEYLGIGLGASSLVNHTRFSNIRELDQYRKLCNQYRMEGKRRKSEKGKENWKMWILEDAIGIRTEKEELSTKERMEEFMFLGLRLCRGISKNTFQQLFGDAIESVYGSIIKGMLKKGLIEEEGDILRLTDYGMDISNYVLAEFILE